VYAGIDVLVVPSIWYENSPNVILEAFAHQTPVIASDLGGMAELVDDQETGLLFVPNDAEDLVRKLEMLLNDPGLLTRLRKNIVSPKSLETEMAELLSVYQLVMAQHVNSYEQ
jgi:glycosyltransferase involved in cell wall biosynthesis